jgi:hypothetical protein
MASSHMDSIKQIRHDTFLDESDSSDSRLQGMEVVGTPCRHVTRSHRGVAETIHKAISVTLKLATSYLKDKHLHHHRLNVFPLGQHVCIYIYIYILCGSGRDCVQTQESNVLNKCEKRPRQVRTKV